MQNFHIMCHCGHTVTVNEGAVGIPIHCRCGRTIPVPSLRQLRQEFGVQTADDFDEDEKETSPNPQDAGWLNRRLPVWVIYLGGFVIGGSAVVLVGVQLGPFAAGGLLLVIGHLGLFMQAAFLVPRIELVLMMVFIPIIGPLLMLKFILEHWRHTWWCVLCWGLGLFLMLTGVLLAPP